MFQIGQKVVCVDDADHYGKDAVVISPINGHRYRLLGDMSGLTKGEIYTITGFSINTPTGKPTVFLQEIPSRGPEDQGFGITRFRPIVEKKTDISALVALLNPVNHKHLEGV